ncbi:M13 family metallopeptidase [Niveibacterium terrae]|uniref:M13 family metallopeptidase n=1 Tax=Niveibacterium terrae TaxID=3373598 RepID=UPI003A935096
MSAHLRDRGDSLQLGIKSCRDSCLILQATVLASTPNASPLNWFLRRFADRAMRKSRSFRFLALLILLAGSGLAQASSFGLDMGGSDAAVRPQDDLFRAGNGAWLAHTEIPADRSWYGIHAVLRDQSDQHLREIVQELQLKHPQPGTIAEKVANFYASYLDTAAIDAAGLSPLQPRLKEIADIADRHELAAQLGRLQGVLETPVTLNLGPDQKDPEHYSVTIWQGGLGLPDRDFYLDRSDARMAQAREAYRQYLETLFRLAGDDDPVQSARQVYELEESIARSHWSQAKCRDLLKTYHPVTLSALRRLAPGMDWELFWRGAGLPAPQKIILGQPDQVAATARLLAQVPLTVWKRYLTVHLLDATATVLPRAFRDASFAFHGRALNGAEQERPRWRLAIGALNRQMGEAVGQLYVERHFSSEQKLRARALVDKLFKAFSQSIDGLTWMSAGTRERAQQKLANYQIKIGYPDRWRDYSSLTVKNADAVGNLLRAKRFAFDESVKRIDDKVDRQEWSMLPQTIDAYYNPMLNEIVFPAAVLQPPFFDAGADDAANYGAIGALIGHEISHGFDDQGSRYDGRGRLHDWWTRQDRKAFDAIGARVVTQYNAYEPIPGRHIDGRLTLGENLADISGLQVAFKAYQLSLEGKPSSVIDGLSGEQRFFFSWAQLWRDKERESLMLQNLATDPHSPNEFRVNGAAANCDAFHQAFSTRPGDRMYKAPGERLRIW